MQKGLTGFGVWGCLGFSASMYVVLFSVDCFPVSLLCCWIGNLLGLYPLQHACFSEDFSLNQKQH